jgi:glyoxylase-like metal-dependent hydrolase (beta-lactamase superfamily II)
VLHGLHPLGCEPLPFAPTLDIRAFVLRRDHGNLLVYSTASVELDADVSRQYLNHRHEAGFVSPGVTAPVFCHDEERATVAASHSVGGSFSTRHMLDDDFEAIPTPGHTSGATAFLWQGAEHRFLFTGDTIYLSDGGWVAAVLESSDRGAYLESLELIRELEFDVLVPWAATTGQPYHAMTSAADARRRIDAIHARIRRGEDR